MKSLIFSAKPFSVSFYILLFLIHLPSFNGATNNLYAICLNVFSCGAITGIDYPFYGGDRPVECGYPGLELDCDDDVATIEIMNVKYRVLKINQETQILTIARDDLSEDICLEEFVSTSLDPRLFNYASEYINLTLRYGCPTPGGPPAGQFDCPVGGVSYTNGYVQTGPDQGPATCHASIVVPIKNTPFEGSADVGTVLAQGFEVEYKVDSTPCIECKNSSGRCGYDQPLRKFSCLCANQTSGSETCLRSETDPRTPEVPQTPETPGSNEGSSQQVPSPDAVATIPGPHSESEPKPKPKPGPGMHIYK